MYDTIFDFLESDVSGDGEAELRQSVAERFLSSDWGLALASMSVSVDGPDDLSDEDHRLLERYGFSVPTSTVFDLYLCHALEDVAHDGEGMSLPQLRTHVVNDILNRLLDAMCASREAYALLLGGRACNE